VPGNFLEFNEKIFLEIRNLEKTPIKNRRNLGKFVNFKKSETKANKKSTRISEGKLRKKSIKNSGFSVNA
jgi:hypothetical protein